MGSHVCVQHVRSLFFSQNVGLANLHRISVVFAMFGRADFGYVVPVRIGLILADDDVYLRSYDSAVCFARPGAAFVETKNSIIEIKVTLHHL